MAISSIIVRLWPSPRRGSRWAAPDFRGRRRSIPLVSRRPRPVGTATERVRVVSSVVASDSVHDARTSLGAIRGTSGDHHAPEVGQGVVNSKLAPVLLTTRTRSVAVFEKPLLWDLC